MSLMQEPKMEFLVCFSCGSDCSCRSSVGLCLGIWIICVCVLVWSFSTVEELVSSCASVEVWNESVGACNCSRSDWEDCSRVSL